jgi:molecular chaperone IbpA
MNKSNLVDVTNVSTSGNMTIDRLGGHYYPNFPNTFNDIIKQFIGFDDLFGSNFPYNQMAKIETYPPYNVVKTGDNNYSIQLAVTGFSQDELSAAVCEGVLTVTGKHSENRKDTGTFLHRGLSQREFTRSFKLLEYIEVENISVQHGVMTINFVRNLPEERKLRQIPVDFS